MLHDAKYYFCKDKEVQHAISAQEVGVELGGGYAESLLTCANIASVSLKLCIFRDAIVQISLTYKKDMLQVRNALQLKVQ